MIINTQTVKKTSGGNNNYSVLGGILDDNELIYPSTKTPEGTVFVPSDNPADYTKVDWIESHGTEYINTGYIPNTNTDIEIVVTETATDESYPYWFGCEDSSVTNRFGVWHNTSSYMALRFTPISENLTGSNYPINIRYTLKYQHGIVTINDVQVANQSPTYSLSYPVGLFTMNKAGDFSGDGQKAKTRCELFKASENGTGQRNMLPVYHTDTGILGMFDSVNNKFYMNAGTGDFTKPSDTSGEINLAEYLASLT